MSKNRFTVKLSCAVACKGRLTVKTTGKKPVTIGSASYSLAAGQSKRYTVKLTAKGRSLLRHSRKVRVTISAGSTKTVTLRR